MYTGRAASLGLASDHRDKRQLLTLGSLKIKLEGYVQGPVSVASAILTVLNIH